MSLICIHYRFQSQETTNLFVSSSYLSRDLLVKVDWIQSIIPWWGIHKKEVTKLLQLERQIVREVIWSIFFKRIVIDVKF